MVITMEYFVLAMNIDQAETNVVGFFENIDKILAVINSLSALVVIIIGLSWLRPLKEKQNAASFTFWSKLRVRLIQIHRHLQVNDNCLYYLYSPIVSSRWDAILAPDPEEFHSLKDVVDETLTFLQGADDQMPPYFGWTDDYTKLIESLTDIIVFDICEPSAKFRYQEIVEYGDLLNKRKDICDLIISMCSKIENNQKSIESKLTVARYKRIWMFLQKARFCKATVSERSE